MNLALAPRFHLAARYCNFTRAGTQRLSNTHARAKHRTVHMSWKLIVPKAAGFVAKLKRFARLKESFGILRNDSLVCTHHRRRLASAFQLAGLAQPDTLRKARFWTNHQQELGTF